LFTHAHGGQDLSTLRWNWTLSQATQSQAQVFWTRDTQLDHNPAGELLLETANSQFGLREVVTHDLSTWQRMEAGVTVRQLQERLDESSIWDYSTGTIVPGLVPLASFSRSGSQTGAFVQDTLRLAGERLKLNVGGRWDRFSATGQAVWLPQANATFEVRPNTQVAASIGQYAQFPSLEDLYGGFGTPGLRAERATHEMVSLDQFFTEQMRLHVEIYSRSEGDVIYAPETQFRQVANGQYALPRVGPVLSNSLEGYSRGIEISLQRRSANGLSGWVSYSRGYTKYRQPGTSRGFWGDFDQRNTLSAYGSYRMSATVSISASARYGSGTPLPGYLSGPVTLTPGGGGGATLINGSGSATVEQFRLAENPNEWRMPAYERVDMRLNKVFNHDHFKLTVYAEVANIFGHQNWRYYDFVFPADVQRSGRAYGTRNTTMPLLPSAGFSAEF
jgi:hypothetical protein